jgi:hypothetical protein
MGLPRLVGLCGRAAGSAVGAPIAGWSVQPWWRLGVEVGFEVGDEIGVDDWPAGRE